MLAWTLPFSSSVYKHLWWRWDDPTSGKRSVPFNSWVRSPRRELSSPKWVLLGCSCRWCSWQIAVMGTASLVYTRKITDVDMGARVLYWVPLKIRLIVSKIVPRSWETVVSGTSISVLPHRNLIVVDTMCLQSAMGCSVVNDVSVWIYASLKHWKVAGSAFICL